MWEKWPNTWDPAVGILFCFIERKTWLTVCHKSEQNLIKPFRHCYWRKSMSTSNFTVNTFASCIGKALLKYRDRCIRGYMMCLGNGRARNSSNVAAKPTRWRRGACVTGPRCRRRVRITQTFLKTLDGRPRSRGGGGDERSRAASSRVACAYRYVPIIIIPFGEVIFSPLVRGCSFAENKRLVFASSVY
jgi:hypothetical protein